MESPTLSTAEKEAVLKMAGYEVTPPDVGRKLWVVNSRNPKFWRLGTAFTKAECIDKAFETLCNRQ